MRPIRFHAQPAHAGFADYARGLPTFYAPVDVPDDADILVVEAGHHHRFLPEGLGMAPVPGALRRGAVLVLDSSREGRRFDPDLAATLQQALLDAGGHPDRCLVLTQNMLLGAAWDAWAAERDGRLAVRVRVLHAFLHAMTRRAPRAEDEQRPAALSWPGREADRRFLCLNRRPAAHRLIALGHLKLTGALARGLVSALRPPQEGAVPPRWEASHPACLAAFRDLAPALPLTLAETPGRSPITTWEASWYRDTAFSLVTESDFITPGVRRFTEKSLKPLVAGHPMLLVAARGTLALLRDLGFRSFAPHINEEYDSLNDPAARMTAVLAEFDRLMALPATGLRALIDALGPVLEHNMAWFRGGLAARLDAEDRELHALIAGMAVARKACT